MKHWPTKALGELALPTEQRDPRVKPTEEFLYVDIAGVDNEAKAIVSTKRLVGAEAPSRARKVIRKGDVIVSTVRPNLNAVAVVPGELDNQICSTGFSVLRPSPKVISGYLFAFVRSPSFIEYLVARTTGANYPAVNDGGVKSVPIPVPPLAEQERIVKLLDEADALRKLRAQADRRTAALLPSIFHEMFGDIATDNDRWPVKPLAELCREISDIDHKMPKAVERGLPFISAKDLLDDGTISFEGVKMISEEDFRRLARKSKPERHDIIYSRIGARLGKARMVEVDFDFLASYSCCTIKPNHDLVDAIFLCYVLDSPCTLKQAHKGIRAIAVPDLGMNEIKNFKIIVPPLSLQREFAQRVTEIHRLEAEQAASRRRLDNLFQSMLHRAFNGEL
jgi:type I restriction enzyme S subunit